MDELGDQIAFVLANVFFEEETEREKEREKKEKIQGNWDQHQKEKHIPGNGTNLGLFSSSKDAQRRLE